MPPRRQRVRLRVAGDRAMRTGAAVALYGDRIVVGDIVEVCAISVSALVREVVRAGMPLRHRSRRSLARSLATMVADARLTDLDRDEWRDSVAVSDATAKIVWYLAGRDDTLQAPDSERPASPTTLLKRRCWNCGGVGSNPERCELCHAPR